jgi:hypothetical protein
MTMTSQRKILANRANSRASTGPKSATGKSRAARNARRHGSAISVSCDPELSARVEKAALEIAGVDAGPERRALARAIAEPQVDLIRVRQARHQLMANIFENPVPVFATQAAAMRSARALITISKSLDDRLPMPFVVSRFLDRLNESEKFALFASDVTRSLAAIDRYETRALSRRKAAIRAFDAAQRAPAERSSCGS